MARFSQVATVPAVVVNANNMLALLPIRSLGRKGIPVICVLGRGNLEQNALKITRFSRFISEMYTFDEADYERNVVSCLCQIGKSYARKSVLFPTSDVDMIIISANREILQKYYHLLMPPHELLSTLLNKDRFYPFAQAQGFPIPKTFRADGLTDIDSIAQEVGYPCIIKPPWRDKAWKALYGNRKVIISHGAEELESNIRRLYAQFKNLTIQEVIQGDEQQIICSFAFLDERSKPLGIFTSKKVRQFPPHFGNSALVQGVCEPRVVELTARICKQLGLVGYVSIEFKKDPKDGEFKLIEITTGRLNRQTGLSEIVGFSIPYIWYCHVLNMPVEIVPSNSECAWISEVNELRAFWEYWRNGEYTVGEWIRSYRNVTCCELFAKDDLLPFIMLLPSVVLDWIRRRVLRQAPFPGSRTLRRKGHKKPAA